MREVQRKRGPLLKVLASFVLLTFGFHQILRSDYPVVSVPSKDPLVPEVSGEESDSKVSPQIPFETSTDFLQNSNLLTAALHDADQDDLTTVENTPVQDNHAFYSLDRALDHLRPEFAAAVILDKPLSHEDFKRLEEHALLEDIEIAAVVLYGQTVLITSGSGDEIAASPAIRGLLDRVSFAFHIHPHGDSEEGPTGPDLEAAGDRIHYLWAPHETGDRLSEASANLHPVSGTVYAYDQFGVKETGDRAWLVENYLTAANRSRVSADAAVRDTLNRLIAAQDILNQIPAEERKTWLAGGTIAYNSNLRAANVTTLPGRPFPYLMAGSVAGTMLTQNADGRFQLLYDVRNAAAFSGFSISFDNASSSAIETQNVAALGSIVLGLQGNAKSVRVQFVDIHGRTDVFTLTNVVASAQRFWKIKASSIASALDKTRIQQIEIYVEQANTTAATRTGNLFVRIHGLNTDPPAPPVITSALPALTNAGVLTLSGTKEANTAILINGTEVIPANASTAWSYNVSLPTDGSHTFNLQAKNSIGKLSTSLSFQVSRDSVLPTGSITINAGQPFTGSRDVTLALTASDAASGLDKVRLSVDGGASWTGWENFTPARSVMLSPGDGNKEVLFQIRDRAGNIAILRDSIFLDTLAPTGTVSINDGANYANSAQVTVTLNLFDSSSGLDSMRFAINDSGDTAYSPWEPFASTKGVTLPNVQGSNTVYVQARDRAGHVLSVSDVILLDTLPPAASIQINNDAVFTNSANVTLNLTGSDAVSGLDQMRFSLDGGTNWTAWENFAATKSMNLSGADGTQEVRLQLRDVAGNITTAGDQILLDTTLPSGTVLINGGAAYTTVANVTLNLTSSDAGSGVDQMRFSLDGGTNWTAWENVAAVKSMNLGGPDGVKEVRFQLRDLAGNVTTASDQIFLDTTRPSISIIINDDSGYTSSPDLTLHLTASDSGSGLDGMRFSVDNGAVFTNWEPNASTKSISVPSGDGRKYVWYQVRDKAGWIITHSMAVILDTTAPSGNVKINADDLYTSSRNVTLTLTASDAGSGLRQIRLSTDGGNTWSNWETYASSKQLTLPSGEGSKEVRVQVQDWIGLTATFTDTIILDSVPPAGSVQINGGSAFSANRNVTLGLSLTDAGSGLDAMRFSMDGGAAWTAFEAFASTKSLTLPPGDGTKQVRVEVRDKAGLVAALSASIILDTTPPGATIKVNQDALYTNNRNITLNLTASDGGSGLNIVRFTADTTNWIWTDWREFTPTVNLTLPPGDGQKAVYFQVYDKVWNLTTVSDTIVLDTTVPTGSVVINNNAAYTASRDVTLGLDATDTLSGVSEMSFAINSTEESAYSAWEPFSPTKNLTLPSFQGPNYVNVRFKDRAGNVTWLWDSIVVDTIAPSGSIKINNDAGYTNARGVTLNLTASDATSGPDQIRFSIDSGTNWTNWEAVASTKSLTLPAGDGTKEVQYQLRDKAGLTATFSDTIILDTVAPVTALLSGRYGFDRHYEMRYLVKDTNLSESAEQKEWVELARGKNRFSRTFTDLAGNSTSVNWDIYLDENAERGTFFDYDSNGNTTSRVDPTGRETKYEYDANNRVTKITYADSPADASVAGGSTVRYTYNQRGDRTSMQDSTGTTFYVYDTANRLRQIIQPTGKDIQYNYDNATNLTEMIYGGLTVKYKYDSARRLTEVREVRTGQSDKVTTYTYNDAGDLTSKTLPNGVRTRNAYDSAGWLTEIIHEKVNADNTSTHLASYKYALDAAGNRTQMVEKRDASQTTRTLDYTYDLFGRLTKEADSTRGMIAYTYDFSGNRLTKEFKPTEVASTNPRILTKSAYGTDNRLLELTEEKYDASDKLLGSRKESFVYDASGNLLQRVTPEKTIHYEYDSENRLVLWTDEKDFVEFFYDGDGNRIGKRVNGEFTYFVVDPNREISQVLAELDYTGKVKQTYTLGLERVSAYSVQRTESGYYLQDGLGSSVGLANSSGAVSESYSYDAFGNFLSSSLSPLPSFLYTGEQFDSETGLVYLRARYYDPSLGRFFSRDPVLGKYQETQSFNPYPYVQNNPTNLIDPQGLISEKDVRDLFNRTIGRDDRLLKPAAMQTLRTSLTERYARKYNTSKSYAQRQVDDWLKNRGGQRNSLYVKPPPPYFRETTLTRARDDDRKVGGGSPPGGGGGGGRSSSSVTNSYNNFARSLLGSSRAGSRGGVLLDKALEITGPSIKDITGVTFDPVTGQVVMLGQDAATVPEISVGYLITALKAVFGTQADPGVSIDPQLLPNGDWDRSRPNIVRHFGGIEDTNLGWVVFEADRLMKSINAGKDNITQTNITQDGYDISESFIISRIPGFQNMATRWADETVAMRGRLWFVPKEMKLVRSAGRDTFVFDNNSVQLLTEDLLVGNGAEDPDAKAYADFFTANYDRFASLYPIFEKLKQAARAVAFAKFVFDHNIPVDLSWLQDATLPQVLTPRTTPWVTIIRPDGSTYFGGVAVDFVNGYNFSYLADSLGEAARIRSDALGIRPTDLTTEWDFTTGGKSFDASALSLAPTRKDANFVLPETDLSFPITGDLSLGFNRYYDSFETGKSSFGFGWSAMPYEIRFPVGRQNYVYGTGTPNQTNWTLHPQLKFVDRSTGQIEDFVLFGLTQDKAYYGPEGKQTGNLLTVARDSTFTMEFEDRLRPHFRTDGQLDQIKDQNGNSVTYTYDVSGRLAEVKDNGTARVLILTYDSSGRVSKVSSPENRSMTFAYHAASGDLISAAEDWTGRKTAYTYDSSHRITESKDFAGKVRFINTYDLMGRLTRQVDADGNTVNVSPNLLAQNTVRLDPVNGASTRETYDSLMRLTGVTDALSSRMSYTYGGAFGPTAVADARGGSTGFDYFSFGNERSRRDPLNHIARFDYGGALGDIRLIFNEEETGYGQYLEYTSTGNLKSLTEGAQPIRDADGNLTGYYGTLLKTQYTYDPKGNLASMIDANSNATSFLYDSVGNRTKITDALGKATEFTYETAGGVPTKRLSSIKDPLNRFLNFTYDSVNEKVTKVSTAAGDTKYAYDMRDRLAQITDALGRITQFKYNANDKLTETREIGDPNNTSDDIVALFDYDRLGNLTSLAGPLGGAASFAYDLLNRMTRILAPETTPLTKVERARVDTITSNSAKIRFNASETVSHAIVRVNEEGRKAFKTITLEGPLSGDVVFEVDGLQAGTKNEYEIEVIDPEAHHAVTRKQSFQTLGVAPAPQATIQPNEKIVGQVWNVTPTTAEVGVFDPDVNYNLVKEYKITYVPKAGGTSTTKTFAPIYQGMDGKYYLTSVAKLENLSADTEYNFTLELVNYPGLPFDKPAPRTGSFRTADPADSSPATFQKNIVTPDVDRATVEFQTSESLLWVAIAVVDYFTGERHDYTYFKPGSSGKLLIPNLKPETTHIYRLLTKDLSGNESASDIPVFTTKGFDGASPLVLKSRVTEKTGTTAKVEILTDEIPEALTVEYREKNAPVWLSSTAIPTARKTVISLAGLTAGKNYEYRVRARDAAKNRVIEEWRDLVLFQEPASPVKEDPSGIFQLALDSTILAQAAQSGVVGVSFELAKKFLGSFKDKYDYLVFIPSLSGGKRLSLETKDSVSDNNTGSFYLGAQNNVKGIGQNLFDYRTSFGSSASGELEGMVVLDSGLSSGPDFRFASSDFTQDKNRILWQNVATQELAHRFGSFLTNGAGNPFGMLGRALAHWGVFFDADFSPLDGNDWVDNGDGTFTLKKSYLDEAAFKRSTIGMPYNDLDLYTMGLLDPNQVQVPFVIENPTLQDGRRLRMHSSGNLVEIQNSDGTWYGLSYLPTGIKIKGTKKMISLSDITALEGARDPAYPNTQKDFKTAFITLTNDSQEESALDTLEMTRKLARFKDSFLRFFQDMARNLGNLLFPKGEAGGGSGGSGGGSGGGGGVFRGLTSLRSATPSGGEAISGLGSPLFSHPFEDQDNPHPFEPIDFTHLKPVGFEETLERLLPSSYFFKPENLFTLSLPGRGEGFLPFSFSSPEAFTRIVSKLPSLATGPLVLISNLLTNDAAELKTLDSKLETPLLYSDWKESRIKSLRDLWPERNAFPGPEASPLSVLDSSTPPQEKGTPSPSFGGRGTTPQVNPTSSPRISQPAPQEDSSNPQSEIRIPKSPSYTPLIWDALASHYRKEKLGNLGGDKPRTVRKPKSKVFTFEIAHTRKLPSLLRLKSLALPASSFSIGKCLEGSLKECLTSLFVIQKPSEYEIRLRKGVKEAKKSGGVLNMKKIMEFDWERLYIFEPYTPNDQMSREIGFEWNGLSFEDEANEGLSHLIFVKDKKVIQYIKYSRAYGDFSEVYKKGGYPPDEAVFQVVKGPKSLFGSLPLIVESSGGKGVEKGTVPSRK